MNLAEPKLHWFWSYLASLFFIAASFILAQFVISPISLTLIFFTLIFLPGFALKRILALNNDLFDALMVCLSLGLVYVFGFCFLAIVFHLNLNQLIILYFATTIVIFFVAFLRDYLKNKSFQLKFNWKTIFVLENLPFLIVFVLALLILLVIVAKGSLLRGGDPLFHLAMIRKTLGDLPLSINNLNYTPNNVLIAYNFPLWHVFSGMIIKILDINLFSYWRAISFPLSILSIFVWLWLFKQIFNKKILIILAAIFFLIFTFDWDNGYIFTTIAIPHTFSQLILLPLLIALMLNYLQAKEKNTINWLIIAVFSGISALIYLSSFFYYVFILIPFLLFYVLLASRETRKESFHKASFLVFSVLAPLLIVILLLEFTGHSFISQAAQIINQTVQGTDYRYGSFSQLALPVRLAFCALPLTLLFIFRRRSLVLIPILFLLLPLTYLDQIRPFLIKALTFIWFKRFYANVVWYWFVWSLSVGAVFLGLDQVLTKFSRFGQKLAALIILGLVTMAIFLQWRFDLLAKVYKAIFSKTTSLWVNNHYIFFIIAVTILAVFTLIWLYKKHHQWGLALTEPKNKLFFFWLTAIITIFMFSPQLSEISPYLHKPKSLVKTLPKTSAENLALSRIGGSDVFSFIQKNIPAK